MAAVELLMKFIPAFARALGAVRIDHAIPQRRIRLLKALDLERYVLVTEELAFEIQRASWSGACMMIAKDSANILSAFLKSTP